MLNFEKRENKEILKIVGIVEQLRGTSSTNEKKEILTENKENKDLQTILELTYNPYKKYGVTEKTLGEGTEDGFTYDNLRMLTYTLATTNINNELREKTNNFLTQTDESIRDLYRCVLLKDLRIGVNSSTINKVWKGLIPASEDTGIEIKPMLASKFNLDKVPKGVLSVTEKIDGIRTNIIVKNGEVKIYTRQGKIIEGLVEIEKDVLDTFQDCVVDGELLAEGCDYETCYKETTKRVKNKDEIKTGVKLMVFDILTLEEFENKKGEYTYLQRREKLNDIKETMTAEHIEILPLLYIGTGIDTILNILEDYRQKGAEGLMINLDKPYEFKRSKSILKLKVMQTADLRIVGFEEGTGKNKGKLGALLVEYKDNIVRVGSGFSDCDRDFIWMNQDMYMGKIAEIQYFEETKNKDGGVSLRFPVWKYIRLDKSEPSYN